MGGCRRQRNGFRNELNLVRPRFLDALSPSFSSPFSLLLFPPLLLSFPLSLPSSSLTLPCSHSLIFILKCKRPSDIRRRRDSLSYTFSRNPMSAAPTDGRVLRLGVREMRVAEVFRGKSKPIPKSPTQRGQRCIFRQNESPTESFGRDQKRDGGARNTAAVFLVDGTQGERHLLKHARKKDYLEIGFEWFRETGTRAVGRDTNNIQKISYLSLHFHKSNKIQEIISNQRRPRLCVVCAEGRDRR